MGRRTLLLLAALVVAALGTTGVFLYVQGVDQRAQAAYEVVEILVATDTIPAGTSAQQAERAGDLELRPFLRTSLAGLSPLSDVTGISTQVALAPIAAGEPILDAQFGDRGQTSALPIPSGQLAVSVQLDDPARVAGFAVAGSQVAIFYTSTDGGGDTTRILLSDVTIIAAGGTTVTSAAGNEAPTEDLPKTLLTLALDQEDAQKIVYASQHGQLYFSLLGEDSTVSQSENGTNDQNLFD